jgi:hypothetical protein
MQSAELASLVAVGGLALGAVAIVVLAARALFLHHVTRQAEAALFQLQNAEKDRLQFDGELRRVVRAYQVAKLRQDLGRGTGSLLQPAAALIRAYEDRKDPPVGRADWAAEPGVEARAAQTRGAR